MQKLTTFLEDNVRYRDGKKWKRRYCMLTKTDSKSSNIRMYITKNYGRATGIQDIDEKNARHYLIDEITGFEYGRHLDKESSVMVLLGRTIVYCIAFSLTETMFRWAETLKKLMNPSHFHVTLQQISESSGLFNKISPGLQGNLHVQSKRFCLIGEPGDGNKFICEWPIENLISVDIFDTGQERTKLLKIRSNNKISKVKGIFNIEINFNQKHQFNEVFDKFLRTCLEFNTEFRTNFFNSSESNINNKKNNNINNNNNIIVSSINSISNNNQICTISCVGGSGINNDINRTHLHKVIVTPDSIDKISITSQEKRSSEIPIPRSREHSGPDQRPIEMIKQQQQQQSNKQSQQSSKKSSIKTNSNGNINNNTNVINKKKSTQSQNSPISSSDQHASSNSDNDLILGSKTCYCNLIPNDDDMPVIDDDVASDNSPNGLLLITNRTTSQESSGVYLSSNPDDSTRPNPNSSHSQWPNVVLPTTDSGYYGDRAIHLLNNNTNTNITSNINTSTTIKHNNQQSSSTSSNTIAHGYMNLSPIYQNHHHHQTQFHNLPQNIYKHHQTNSCINNTIEQFYNNVLKQPFSNDNYNTYLKLFPIILPSCKQQKGSGTKINNNNCGFQRSNSFNCLFWNSINNNKKLSINNCTKQQQPTFPFKQINKNCTEPLTINCESTNQSDTVDNWNSTTTPGSSSNEVKSIHSSISVSKDPYYLSLQHYQKSSLFSLSSSTMNLPFKDLIELNRFVRKSHRSGNFCYSLAGYSQFLMMLKDINQFARLLNMNNIDEASATTTTGGSGGVNSLGSNNSRITSCNCCPSATCKTCFYKMLENNPSSCSNKNNKMHFQSQLLHKWLDKLQNGLLSSTSLLDTRKSSSQLSLSTGGTCHLSSNSSTIINSSTNSWYKFNKYLGGSELLDYNLRLIFEIVIRTVELRQYSNSLSSVISRQFYDTVLNEDTNIDMTSVSSVDKFSGGPCCTAHLYNNCSSCPTSNKAHVSTDSKHHHNPYLYHHQLSGGGSCSNPELIPHHTSSSTLPPISTTSSQNRAPPPPPPPPSLSLKNSTQSSFESPPKYQNLLSFTQNLGSNTNNNTFPKYAPSQSSASAITTANNSSSKAINITSPNSKTGSFKKFRRKCSPSFLFSSFHLGSSKIPNQMFTRRKTPSTHSTLSEPSCPIETVTLPSQSSAGGAGTNVTRHSSSGSHGNMYYNFSNNSIGGSSGSATGCSAPKNNNFTKRSLSVVLDNSQYCSINEPSNKRPDTFSGSRSMALKKSQNYVNIENDIDTCLPCYSKQSSCFSNSDQNSDSIYNNSYINCQKAKADESDYCFIALPEEVIDPSRNYGSLSTTGCSVANSNSNIYTGHHTGTGLLRQDSQEDGNSSHYSNLLGISNSNNGISNSYYVPPRRSSAVSSSSAVSPTNDGLPPPYPSNNHQQCRHSMATTSNTSNQNEEPNTKSSKVKLNYVSIKEFVNSHPSSNTSDPEDPIIYKPPPLPLVQPQSQISTQPSENYITIDVNGTYALLQVDRMLSSSDEQKYLHEDNDSLMTSSVHNDYCYHHQSAASSTNFDDYYPPPSFLPPSLHDHPIKSCTLKSTTSSNSSSTPIQQTNKKTSHFKRFITMRKCDG